MSLTFSGALVIQRRLYFVPTSVFAFKMDVFMSFCSIRLQHSSKQITEYRVAYCKYTV